MTGKKKPKALFIPTASSDDFRYIAWFQMRYGDELGCETEVLCLLGESPSKVEIRRLIEAADVIYVGGGNTLKMMRKWRFLGMDKLLKKAYEHGAIMCGLSAGAICWFEYGHSDSMAYYDDKNWDYIRVKGLGLVKDTFCPHYDSATKGIKRKQNYQKMLRKFRSDGVAADDCAALLFENGRMKPLSEKGAKAYKLAYSGGKLTEKEIK